MNESLRERIAEYDRPKRKALSSRFPFLVGPATFVRKAQRHIKNLATIKKLKRVEEIFPSVVARHSSPLYRKLGSSDDRLQKNKVINLAKAIEKLDGLVIPPGETFSLWKAIGSVTKRKGYVSGMLLSNGKVSEGIGGGLCQLSNFLYWIFLHADTQINERHHHSVDVFPDSGRTLPFGSGATIFHNYLDLKVKNTSKRPLQIQLWLTDNALRGMLLSDAPAENKFHVFERNHHFIKSGERYFRYNEIYREKLLRGQKVSEEKIITNFAPVVYEIDETALRERGHEIVYI
ncbi:MAG TPA: VanW family protein [Candidatus Paceibacterota bacterium]